MPIVESLPALWRRTGTLIQFAAVSFLAACGGSADYQSDSAAPPAGATLSAEGRVSRMAVSAANACSAPANPIVAENCLPGAPQSDWDVGGGGNGDGSIQGFSTDISYSRGQVAAFKIDTDARAYTIEIYRLGYYGGDGARRVATITPSVPLPQTQPPCLNDSSTGLVDCGNWAVSATWNIPSTAVSGVYVARLRRTDTGGASHIRFVVRDDASRSDFLFQTSDTTWHAYNLYGGNSFYAGQPAGRAFKLSYNRPIVELADAYHGFRVNEYPMLRWLEANGYDVTYTTGVDSHRRGELIRNHRIFLSVGHDEYWSGVQRTNVEAARNAGVHLAFFSGNSIYWKTRWEPSTSTDATPMRTLVSYKETWANAKIDPSPEWTGTWRDPRFSPPSDGGRPENALQGTFWQVNCCSSASGPASEGFTIKVSAEMGRMRLWRNTSVATLAPGQVAEMTPGILGFEWDSDVDNGFRPPGLIRQSEATYDVLEKMLDYGTTTGPGTVTHYLTLYKHASGALVFGAGTTRWSWGLDDGHDGGSTLPDQRMRQATVNLFADMGAQPGSLQPGLVGATKSTDTTPPSAFISSPTSGSSVPVGSAMTVTGTASDIGGVVGGVEVSADGGTTWRAAQGRANWSFDWKPTATGSFTLLARAIDDSGNIQTTPTQISVNATPRLCPCSLWEPGVTPTNPAIQDFDGVELGVKFTATGTGYVTGIRFYKGAGNTGAHVGNLWTLGGQRLATVTFTNETSSGWQQALFAKPVYMPAGTTYIASYFAPVGRYAADLGYFASGLDMAPLRVPSTSDAGGNGVYSYSSTSTFPTTASNGTNYWVDVVFQTQITTGSVEAVADSYVGFVNQPLSVPAAGVLLNDSPEAIGLNLTASLVSGTSHGSISVGSDGSFTYTPAPGYSGPDSFTYRATSASGLSAIATVSINVLNATTLFSASALPAVASATDNKAVELGVKFRSSSSGRIIGARFYKGPANTGIHVANLWSASGQLLATASFGSESVDGWQQVFFPSPVTISAGTTYVVSYFAPRGGYSYTHSFFASAYTGGFLSAPASATVGGNGVYRYGAISGFPSETYNDANYWVDPIFESDVMAGTVTVGNDAFVAFAGQSLAVPAPGVLANDGAAGLTDPLTAALVTGPSNGALSFSTNGSFTYMPNPGFTGTDSFTYRATSITGSSAIGTVTLNVVSAMTLFGESAVPAIASVNDPNAVELGMKFMSSVAGQVRGVRFYKGPANTGTHVVNLWSASGQLLASATVPSETASGWQSAFFASPVPIAANTNYVVSYFAPNGGYSYTGAFFASTFASGPLTAPASWAVGGNGVYRYTPVSAFPSDFYNDASYWVDVIFSP